MYQLDIDCISCESENLLLLFLVTVLGCAIGLYLIKRYKNRLYLKKK
jgi:hypothetical protein